MKTRLGRALPLVAGNLAILLGVLCVLNLASWLLLQARDYAKTRRAGAGPVALAVWELPTYEDSVYTEQVFREFDEGIETRYEPFVGWSRLPFRGVTTTIDENGDRVHPAPPGEPTRGVARFFGGSTMWGTGVDDAGTIPAAFSRLHPDFEVHNHGETAYTSRQSLDRLIDIVSTGGAADLVVFFDGVNDVAQQCRRGIPVPGHSRVLQFREAIAQLRPSSAWEHLEALGRPLFVDSSIELGQSLLRKLGVAAEWQDPNLDAYACDADLAKARRVADTLIGTWEVAHDIVRTRGGRFLAILQPNAHTAAPRIDHLEGRLSDELGRNFRAVYPLFEARIHEAGHDWILDLTRAFDHDETAGEYLLIDDFHANARGSEVIARRVAEALDEGLAEPRR